MRYLILILLVGCIENTSVGAPEEGESDVDGMELEGEHITVIEPLGVLDGMAGMAMDGTGGEMDATAGLVDTGSGAGGGGSEGPDSGTGGDAGGEGAAPPVAGDYGDVCGEHGDCIDHPDDGVAGYCYANECVNPNAYDWVQRGESCAFAGALCIDDLVCADGTCVIP